MRTISTSINFLKITIYITYLYYIVLFITIKTFIPFIIFNEIKITNLIIFIFKYIYFIIIYNARRISQKQEI